MFTLSLSNFVLCPVCSVRDVRKVRKYKWTFKLELEGCEESTPLFAVDSKFYLEASLCGTELSSYVNLRFPSLRFPEQCYSCHAFSLNEADTVQLTL